MGDLSICENPSLRDWLGLFRLSGRRADSPLFCTDNRVRCLLWDTRAANGIVSSCEDYNDANSPNFSGISCTNTLTKILGHVYGESATV